jgi:hypothetical protein
MSTTPVLAFPDFAMEFTVETDALDIGIRVVLTQEGHPIAYFSKGLGISNQKLSTYEKEFLTVMMIVDKWRSYLQKKTFTIRTGHQILCHLQDQHLSIDLQRKAMRKLVGLQFRFAYKKGSGNIVTHAFSRVDIHYHLDVIFVVIRGAELVPK